MDLPSGCRLSIEQDPSAADRNFIDEGLGAYNAPFLQDPGYDYFGIFVRDQHNAIRAGLVGNCYAGWLFVNLLWIESGLRRHGVGTALMQAAEQRASALGCHSAWVDTFSFQGPEFYPRFGYEVFATLDCPPNNKRIFFKKQLHAPESTGSPGATGGETTHADAS